jgi:hypothetical protein
MIDDSSAEERAHAPSLSARANAGTKAGEWTPTRLRVVRKYAAKLGLEKAFYFNVL